MSNNIDTQSAPLQVIRPDNGTTAPKSGNETVRNAAQEQATATDTVELTQAALKLQELEVAVANLPEVDSDRVAAIRARIESGDYAPDAQRIADRMIALDAILPGVKADSE